MIIEKQVLSTPYYVPLSAHKIKAYTVQVDDDVVTVTVASYFNKEALSHAEAQALATYSVVLKGKPTGDTLAWIAEQLIATDAERVENEYNYQAGYELADRFMFAGGKVITQ